MSKLKAVAPKTADPAKPKVLIFGAPGVGKTWVSLDFPLVYYVDTEGGATRSQYTDKLEKSGGVYFGIEQGALDFDSVLREVQLLATEDHPYKTVVIDSVTKLFNTAVANEAERFGDKNTFGAEKKPAIALMRKLISWLTKLDMNVILIAHEKSEWGSIDGQRTEIGKMFDCWEKLAYELDLSLHIMKLGSDRKARIKKSRLLGFPENTLLPWSYADFAAAYGKEVIDRGSVKLVLATPEQLAEINRLLAIVKIPDGQEKKWFKAANCDSYEDMESSKLDKLITHVTNTFLKGAPQ